MKPSINGVLLLPTILLFSTMNGCEPRRDTLIDRYPSFPDTETRNVAKKIKASQVTSVSIRAFSRGVHRSINITDQRVIKQLLLGLTHATDTNILNQVSHVQLNGSRGSVLLWENFALDGPEHALSPDFIIGLKQAGVILPWEEAARRRQQWTFGALACGGILLLGLLPLWLLTRRRPRKQLK